MRKALALMGLFILARPVFASLPCELRLTTSIAIVTAKALERNQLELKDVERFASAAKPENPLRDRVPLPEIVRLRDYYNLVIPTLQNWSEVQAELRQVIVNYKNAMGIREKAEEATATVWGPHLLHHVPPGWVGERDFFRLPSGRYVFALREGAENLKIFGPENLSPLWSGAYPGTFKVIEDKAGKVQVVAQTPLPPEKDFLLAMMVDEKSAFPQDPTRRLVRYESAVPRFPDLSEVKLSWLDENGDLTPINSKPLRYRIVNALDTVPRRYYELQDGSIAAVGGESEGKSPGSGETITYFPPFKDEPTQPLFLKFHHRAREARVVQTVSGRVFVLATGYTDESLAVYEPSVSVEPIFKHEYLHNKSFALIEFEGRVLLVVIERKATASELTIIEPLKSQEPFAVAEIPFSATLAGLIPYGQGRLGAVLTNGVLAKAEMWALQWRRPSP